MRAACEKRGIVVVEGVAVLGVVGKGGHSVGVGSADGGPSAAGCPVVSTLPSTLQGRLLTYHLKSKRSVLFKI